MTDYEICETEDGFILVLEGNMIFVTEESELFNLIEGATEQ